MSYSAVDVRSKSIKGLNTSFIFLGLTGLISLLRRIILARLLLPEHFGLFAFTTIIVVVVSNFARLHMQDAVVQTRSDPRKMLSTAFTSQLFVSSFVFVMLLAFSGIISRGAHKPEMSPYLRVASLVFLTVPFGLPVALFVKELDIFRVKLPIALGAVANALVCILMAASGFGVWSLVTGYVLDALVNSVVIWGFAPHRPRLGVDRKMLLEIIRFSLPLYLLSILFWIFWQGDDFMVGLAGDRSLGISGNIALGYYSIAFYFPHQLTRIRAELAGVSFPAFLALRDDIKRLSSAFQAVTRNNAIFILSVGAVAIPLAGPAVLYVLGEKWLPSVHAFQVLMVAAMARTLFGAVGELYKSLGKTRALLWSYIPNPVLLIFLGPYVALNHGILGMALLVTGIIVVTQPIGIFLTKRVLHDVNFTRLLWKPLIVFSITISVGWAISSHVETRTCFVASVLSLVFIYYGLMAGIDRRFRMTAIDYLRTSFRRPK